MGRVKIISVFQIVPLVRSNSFLCITFLRFEISLLNITIYDKDKIRDCQLAYLANSF